MKKVLFSQCRDVWTHIEIRVDDADLIEDQNNEKIRALIKDIGFDLDALLLLSDQLKYRKRGKEKRFLPIPKSRHCVMK